MATQSYKMPSGMSVQPNALVQQQPIVNNGTNNNNNLNNVNVNANVNVDSMNKKMISQQQPINANITTSDNNNANIHNGSHNNNHHINNNNKHNNHQSMMNKSNGMNGSSSSSSPMKNVLNGNNNNNNNNNQSSNTSNVVRQSHDFVHQMNQARSAHHFGNYKVDDYDPDSNVYVANLPSAYGKERLYQLFAPFGQIVRYKFVTPDEPTQPGYGFVQFAHRKGAHKSIKALEGHTFSTGEVIYLSIALRRRSSLSDEPTNLYVKNLPSHWSNEKLRKVFSAFGQIRQSKVVGDGIAFVRYEDHEQALEAIQKMDKHTVETGFKLEVRFATRKTAANAYRLQQVPSTKSNENNLYIRNLPKFYSQQHLEQLFIPFGKISSAKINDNGIAFVRFAHGEDAQRAIKELNGQKPNGFTEEIVVKLAHFDIGDSRNRWNNKFQGSLNGSGHFNNNVYQNHFNAPTMGHGGGGGYNGHSNPYSSGYAHSVSSNVSSHAPLSSVPSVSSDSSSENMSRMTNLMGSWSINSNNGMNNAMNNNMNNTMNGANNGHSAVNNMNNMNLNNQMHNQRARNNNTGNQAQSGMQRGGVLSPTSLINPQTLQTNNFGFAQQATLINPAQTLQAAQLLNFQQANGNGALSPQNGNRPPNSSIFTKKQQALGDVLYQKVFAKCTPETQYAPKITGMLLKMGDQKAQEYIDNPQLLEEQIKIAKKLLQTSSVSSPGGALQAMEGMPSSIQQTMNRYSQNAAQANGVTATGLQSRMALSNPTFSVNINRLGSNPAQFQALNTKPITPTNYPLNTMNPNIANSYMPHAQQLLFAPNAQLLNMSPQTVNSPHNLASGQPLTPQSNTPTNATAMPNMNAQNKTPTYFLTANLASNLIQSPLVQSPAQQNIYNMARTPERMAPNTIQSKGWGLAIGNPTVNVIQPNQTNATAQQIIHNNMNNQFKNTNLQQ